MMPCKLASPAFAVTAAILGGLALAMSTCQAAVIDLFDRGAQPVSIPGTPDDQNSLIVDHGPFHPRHLGLTAMKSTSFETWRVSPGAKFHLSCITANPEPSP